MSKQAYNNLMKIGFYRCIRGVFGLALVLLVWPHTGARAESAPPQSAATQEDIRVMRALGAEDEPRPPRRLVLTPVTAPRPETGQPFRQQPFFAQRDFTNPSFAAGKNPLGVP